MTLAAADGIQSSASATKTASWSGASFRVRFVRAVVRNMGPRRKETCMGLCIGYESALRYWLTKTGDEAMPEYAQEGAFRQVEASSALVKEGILPLGPEPSRPLHLVVRDPALKHRIRDCAIHVCRGNLPSGSFHRLAGGNIISSPELTFLQMASCASKWQLIEAGNYLCSTFSISDEGRGYTGKREQLVSAGRLGEFLDSLPSHTYGVDKAKAALKYVVELTASPKESQLAMHYALPAALGGRGPMELVANQVIHIDEHGQRMLGSNHLVGDLFLPDFGCDLEFDSVEFHTGRFRLDHTQARRNVLEAMGIKTVSATEGQINTLEKLDDFTWLLEERLGAPHPTYTREQRLAQIDLFDWLNDPRRTLF